MQRVRSREQAASEDIYFGQVVANWARWFVIGSGVLSILWLAEDTAKLIVGVLPIVGLMAVNFYLHGRLLAGRPANRILIGIATAIDIVLITGLVTLWPGVPPLDNGFFVMYYPILLAFAFIMEPRISVTCTLAVMLVYGIAVISLDTSVMNDLDAVETLITRLITICAIGVLGSYFWRMQRARRRQSAALSED